MPDAAYYRAKAANFRSLAAGSDAQTARDLLMLAKEYELLAQSTTVFSKTPRPTPDAMRPR